MNLSAEAISQVFYLEIEGESQDPSDAECKTNTSDKEWYHQLDYI